MITKFEQFLNEVDPYGEENMHYLFEKQMKTT